ncbi:hypothetical protein EOL96_01420 [Candidatus Saccharibacteria bacterium]|nr:hypothetical protein [Candidatus Saccharibacteria bacterium]
MITSPQNIQALRNKKTTGQKLSIYIPTHPKSNRQTISEDTIRFKNALQDVKNDPSYDESSLKDTMTELYKLLDDTEFWKHQDVGLAVFGDTDGYEYFNLPYETTAATYLAPEFVTSPLVIAHSIGSGFYVLDVNLNSPRLYRTSNGTLIEVCQDEMPGSFQDTVARDEYNVELQHQATPRSSGDTSFHGHDPADSVDDDTKRYLRIVADSVDGCMKDHDQPLILSGTENRVGNFRQYLSYVNVLPDVLTGNKEELSAQQLYGEAIHIAATYDQAQRQASIDKLISSAPEFVVMGAKEIREAASAGRIERLYLPVYRRTTDTVRPGDFASIIFQLPDDIKELDQLVQATLAQGGEVLATEIDSYEGADMPRALCRF